MDLGKIREFIVFSRSLNFSNAARDLHVSQSALSKHIRDIENELEVVLVERGTFGGPNTLTPAGRTFLERAVRLLDQYDEMVAACRKVYSALPPVRVHDMRDGFNVVAQLRRQLERAGIATGNFAYVDVVGPIEDALDSGAVDLAMHFESVPRMVRFAQPGLRERYGWIGLEPERLLLVVEESNALARKGVASTSDLAGRAVLTVEGSAATNWVESAREVFERYGCRLDFRVVRDTPHDGGAFPLGSRDVVLCTERFARYYGELGVEDVCKVRFTDVQPVVYPFLVYCKDAASEAMRAMTEALGMLGDGS